MEQLALRKELLRARSSLYRLKMQHQFRMMGNHFQWTKVGSKAVHSLPIRSAILGIIFKLLPETKVSRLITLVSKVAVFTKITRIAFTLIKKA